MCGLLVLRGARPPFHHRMLNSLRRRGPDQIGFWSDGDLHLAQTRLAIIGLDDRGTAPLENETHVLVFNGEVYNFLEINQQLAAENLHVRVACDAETLLHAWSRWGESILPKLSGFWSFVLYDKRARKLYLVRDQYGVKPLYYWKSNGFFAASSLLHTLVEVAGPKPDLDHEALSEYVRYQFTFGDKTFFRQIRKVEPGHVVEYDLDRDALTTRRYEDIFAAPAILQPQTREWMEETNRVLVESVLESTISDTPFASSCSGGIDSSLVTRIARPEVAYHCNYSDPECNETFFAKQAVENTPIRLMVVNAEESFHLIERMRSIVEDFDELSIGSVILPLEDLLAHVKRRYKVLLTGTGGDELFGGYVRYQLVLGECYQDSYRALYEKMKKLRTPAERFEYTHRKGDPSLYRFYRPEVERTFLAEFEKGGDDPLAAMLRFDRRNFLQGLLNIDDKMAGRHSLEVRPSLLHQKFVRRVVGLDPRVLLADHHLKGVLRTLAERHLPTSVVRRTDKMGFTTPIGTFINHSAHLIREQLTGSRFRDLYDFKKMAFTAENKFSREVFGLLLLDLWLNRYA